MLYILLTLDCHDVKLRILYFVQQSNIIFVKKYDFISTLKENIQFRQKKFLLRPNIA